MLSNQYLERAFVPSDDASKEKTSTRPFHTATVDLDLGAAEALKQLGWLDNAQPASQMTVNEACTLLVRYALNEGLAASPSRPSNG
jgi:hypothetical protein